MHSILGRGRRPAFREEQGWKESPSSHTTTTATQSPDFHAAPLFATPSGSLQDILRPSVHVVQGSSAFTTVLKPSHGSQLQQQPPAEQQQQAEIIAQQAAPVLDSTTRNLNVVGVPVPVTQSVRDDGFGKLPPSALQQRKQLQCHTTTWDQGMRNDHVFEGYRYQQHHVGLREISSCTPLQQQQLDSFKTMGTWTATQAAAAGPGDSDQQQWTDLRKNSSKATLLSISPDIDHHGSCQPSTVWRERWSDSPSVPASSADMHTAAAAHLDESTDGGSDPMDEKSSRRWSGTAGYCSSRNLFSERKRRKKMNDGLYSLRSLVPNISKMDKASIIGDAIKYVMELERQVKELEGEMELDEQRQHKLKTSFDNFGSSSLAAVVGSHEAGPGEAVPTENDSDSRERSSTTLPKVDLKDPPNIKLELSKMKSGLYNLRMYYHHQPGIFMHMTQAIESLDLNILSSHVSTCDGYVVHSLIAKAKLRRWKIRGPRHRPPRLEIQYNIELKSGLEDSEKNFDSLQQQDNLMMTSWDDSMLGDVEDRILGLVRQFQ